MMMESSSSDSEPDSSETVRSRKNKKSNSVSKQSGTRTDDRRILSGCQDVPPKKRIENQGQEIIQVVEELMDQALTLKERLINMIAYFQQTIGTCAELMHQTSDLSELLCTCKSGYTLTSQCTSKGGSIIPSAGTSTKNTFTEVLDQSFRTKLNHTPSNIHNIPTNYTTAKENLVESEFERKQASHNIDSTNKTTIGNQKQSLNEAFLHKFENQDEAEYIKSSSRQKGGASIVNGSQNTTQLTKRIPQQSENGTLQTEILSNLSEETVNAADQLTKQKSAKTKPSQQTINTTKLSNISDPINSFPDETKSINQRQNSRRVAPTSSSLFDVEERVKQVQEDIQELRYQMTLLPTCPCTTHGTVFAQTLSSQLLGKTNEIKDILNTIKSDCYQRINMSAEQLLDIGQQTVTQKCEKEIRRVHPEYTRIVNQAQNIEAERNRTGNVQTAKVMEAMKTKIDTKYKDIETPENVVMNTKIEATERLKNIGPSMKQRETKTETAKTLKAGKTNFHEVNTIHEDDVDKKDGQIITTTKKVTRTERFGGSEPIEKVITNITIHRVIDNRTGKVTETVTEGDKSAIEKNANEPDQRKSRGKNKPPHLAPTNYDNTLNKSFEKTIVMPSKKLKSTSYEIDGLPVENAAYKSVSERDESEESVSELISKISYADDEFSPPLKVTKTTPVVELVTIITEKSAGSNRKSNFQNSTRNSQSCTHAEEQSAIKKQMNSMMPTKTMPGNNLQEVNPRNQSSRPDFLERESAGFSLKQTCSKVRYVAPNSEIPGVKYIGCQKSDMSKYPSHRSKVSANKRLIVETKPSKTSMRVSNYSRYFKPKQDSPTRSQESVSDDNDMDETSQHVGGNELEVKSESIQTQPELKRANNSPARSKVSKPVFREIKDSLNRSVGGTTIDISTQEKKIPKSSLTRDENTGVKVTPEMLPAASIVDIIKKLSDSISPKDFFVSILPEKIEVKVFRINVIDKETGKVLGHFFVDEEEFKKARDDGIFDNYLSLFILNSLGSYNDFVENVSVVEKI